jgi:hypothetical protein
VKLGAVPLRQCDRDIERLQRARGAIVGHLPSAFRASAPMPVSSPSGCSLA